MMLLREGTWSVSSRLDPRWNASGHCMCGGFVIPREAAEHIDAKKRELGDPPTDLEWGYMKD